MKTSQKIEYFESLRGIAALVVLFHHANFIYASPITTGFVEQHGYLLVDFFFVLSGWVIALNYAERIGSLAQIASFQMKRFLRLYPLHILTLIAVFGVEVLKLIAESKLGADPSYPAFSHNNLTSLLQNVLFLQVPLGKELTWNYPSWSIAAEFQTYFLFAVAVWLGGRYKYAVISGALVLGFVFLWPNANTYNISVGYDALARCIMAFSLGVLLQKTASLTPFRLPKVFDFLVLVLTLLACGFASAVPGIFFPFIFGAAIFSLAITDYSFVKRMLEHRFLVFFGTISYGLYMWHVVVWFIISNALELALKPEVITVVGEGPGARPDADMMVVGLAAGLGAHLVGLAIIIVLSYLSHRFIEMPANNLRKRISFTK